MPFPRAASNNDLILTKLKGKAEYDGYILFIPVRWIFVGSFLRWLKQFNQFYSNMRNNVDNT